MICNPLFLYIDRPGCSISSSSYSNAQPGYGISGWVSSTSSRKKSSALTSLISSSSSTHFKRWRRFSHVCPWHKLHIIEHLCPAFEHPHEAQHLTFQLKGISFNKSGTSGGMELKMGSRCFSKPSLNLIIISENI